MTAPPISLGVPSSTDTARAKVHQGQYRRHPTVQDASEPNVVFIHSRLDDFGLSPQEFRVFCHLARRAGRRTAFPSVCEMARVCRLHPQTVRSALKMLTSHFLLTREGRPGTTAVHRLTPPSQWRPLKRVRETPSETDPSPSFSGASLAKGMQSHPSETQADEGGTIEGNPVKEICDLQTEKELVALWNSKQGFEKIQHFTESSPRTRHFPRLSHGGRTAGATATATRPGLSSSGWRRLGRHRSSCRSRRERAPGRRNTAREEITAGAVTESVSQDAVESRSVARGRQPLLAPGSPGGTGST